MLLTRNTYIVMSNYVPVQYSLLIWLCIPSQFQYLHIILYQPLISNLLWLHQLPKPLVCVNAIILWLLFETEHVLTFLLCMCSLSPTTHCGVCLNIIYTN